MALKSISDKDLVEGDVIKYHCEKCNKNVVMKIMFAPEGMLGKCCSCRNFITLKKNENYIPETTEIKNLPKCPTCSSTNLQKISVTSKVVNTAMFGVLGTKRHKTFHCNNCGYEW